MSKIFLSIGHGGADVGAVAVDGSYEKNIALEIGLYLKEELVRHGVKVAMSREKDESDKVADEVAECNAFAPDYGVSIHLNASSSHSAAGFEVYHSINTQSKGVTLAKNINDSIVEHGIKSRGLKTRANSKNKDYYAWIRNTSAPVVLCEIGFIDNKENYEQIDTVNERKSMASFLAMGILKTLAIEYVQEKNNETKQDGTLYTVQCGAFSIQENATALAEKLKKAGYNAIVVEKQG